MFRLIKLDLGFTTKGFVFVIPLVILLVFCSSVFVAQCIPDTFYLSVSAKLHFLNWHDQNRCCSVTSKECERYFETVHHLSCYFVYGHKGFRTDDWTAHRWNIVMIDDVPYEFESTSLVFKEVSKEYAVQDVQEGFFVDGIRFEKCQRLDDWVEIISECHHGIDVREI